MPFEEKSKFDNEEIEKIILDERRKFKEAKNRDLVQKLRDINKMKENCQIDINYDVGTAFIVVSFLVALSQNTIIDIGRLIGDFPKRNKNTIPFSQATKIWMKRISIAGIKG